MKIENTYNREVIKGNVYVKINAVYTATVRSLFEFVALLNREQPNPQEVEVIEVSGVSGEFLGGVNEIIDIYKGGEAKNSKEIYYFNDARVKVKPNGEPVRVIGNEFYFETPLFKEMQEAAKEILFELEGLEELPPQKVDLEEQINAEGALLLLYNIYGSNINNKALEKRVKDLMEVYINF